MGCHRRIPSRSHTVCKYSLVTGRTLSEEGKGQRGRQLECRVWGPLSGSWEHKAQWVSQSVFSEGFWKTPSRCVSPKEIKQKDGMTGRGEDCKQLSVNLKLPPNAAIFPQVNKWCHWPVGSKPVPPRGDSGWGTRVHPWLIRVDVWWKPLQYCKVISFQLKQINLKKPNTSRFKSPAFLWWSFWF